MISLHLPRTLSQTAPPPPLCCSSSLCKCTGKSTAPTTQWEAAAGLSAAAGITAAIYHNYLSPLKEAKLLLKEPEPNALCQCHNCSTGNVSGCGLVCVCVWRESCQIKMDTRVFFFLSDIYTIHKCICCRKKDGQRWRKQNTGKYLFTGSVKFYSISALQSLQYYYTFNSCFV